MSEISATKQDDQPSGTTGAGDGRRLRTWAVFLGLALATGAATGTFTIGAYHLTEYAFDRQGGKVLVLLLVIVNVELLALTLMLIRRIRSIHSGHGDRAVQKAPKRPVESIGIPMFVLWELVVCATAVFIMFGYLNSAGTQALKDYAALIFLVVPFSQLGWALSSVRPLRHT